VTILVTGGTGFLGSYFTRHAVLEQQAKKVVVFDRYIDRGRIADVLDRVTLVEGDVGDFDQLNKVIRDHGVERIAHFAFILGSPKPDMMIPYVQVQCMGTVNVFEAARAAGVDRVLFCSSVAAYGTQQASVLTEDLVVNPSNPYASCKAWCEDLGRHYNEQLGLDVVSLRFGSTYGLGRGWRGSYNSGIMDAPEQVHYMARVEDAVRGYPIELPRGDELADWTYAGDTAQAAWRALMQLKLAHDLYNVSAERRPVGDFTRILRELLPDAQITTATAEMPGNAHPLMSNERLVRDLGFAPAFSLESGVSDYIERIRSYDKHHGAHA